MNKTILLFAVALAMLPAAASAQAACSQASAAGRWNIHALANSGQVTRCAVSINSFGKIAPATCATYGAFTGNVALSGGTVTMSNAARCAFRGTIVFDGVVNTVQDLALSRDAGNAAGIGTAPPAATFILNMTRY